MATEVDNVLSNMARQVATQEELKDVKPERIMGMRWILTWKTQDDGTQKGKARMVVLGYQHPEQTQLETASPTISRNSRHMLFATTAIHGFVLEHADASSAFLQSDETVLKKNIYVRTQPKMAAALGIPARDAYGAMAKVRKSFYGLTNAPRTWWNDITKKLAN